MADDISRADYAMQSVREITKAFARNATIDEDDGKKGK